MTSESHGHPAETLFVPDSLRGERLADEALKDAELPNHPERCRWRSLVPMSHRRRREGSYGATAAQMAKTSSSLTAPAGS